MNKPFRFGVVAAFVPSHAAWIALARRAEETGYASLLMPDRPSMGGLAPFSALAMAAEATSTLHVGSYVFSNGYRHPALLAQEIATLQQFSGGRFEAGMGAGVSSNDLQQLGLPAESAGTRVGQLEEALHILKQFFTQETVSFTGKYYTIGSTRGYGKQLQSLRVPLLIAGASERMLKLAAREADSIAIGAKFSGRGPDPTDASLEQKLTWIKEAAGERFSELEFCQSIYDMVITDSPTPLLPQAGGPPIPKKDFSTAQAVARLLEERERYGFSYLQVYEGQMENFAPVVAQLQGK